MLIHIINVHLLIITSHLIKYAHYSVSQKEF